MRTDDPRHQLRDVLVADDVKPLGHQRPGKPAWKAPGALSEASTPGRAATHNTRGTINDAVQRFQSKAQHLASFADAGLTYDDFVQLGLENVVRQGDFEPSSASSRREARQGNAKNDSGAE